MADFPDVNVWEALSAVDHALHSRAEKYWATEANQPLVFCRTTALGLIRVTSQRHSIGGNPLAPVDAWSNYRNWREVPGVDFLVEPSRVEDLIGDWCEKGLANAKNWTDLYLAAFAVSANLRLVTFDRDFKAFPGLDLLHLEL